MIRFVLGAALLLTVSGLVVVDSLQSNSPVIATPTAVVAPAEDCLSGDSWLPDSGAPVGASVVLRIDYPQLCPNGGQLPYLSPGVLRLTNAATGEPLESRPGLDAGRNGTSAVVSPNGKLLAFTGIRIHLIDLETWSEKATMEKPGILQHPLLWSPDSSRIYFFGGEPKDRRLWVIDADDGTIRQLPDLPFDSLTDAAFSRDGRILYGLASDLNDMGPTTGAWSVKGETYVSGVEVETGQELVRIPVLGLQIGDGADYVRSRPAAVLDEGRGRMYVVHADSDAVSVVDLKSGSVAEMEAASNEKANHQEGFAKRVLKGVGSLLAGTAEAKGNGELWRWAALSKDGSKLLIGGFDDLYEGTAESRQPAGLRVLDAATMRELYRVDGIENFAETADASRIIGLGYGWRADKGTSYLGDGLVVLDEATGRELAQLGMTRHYSDAAFSLDGRYLQAIAMSPELEELHAQGIYQCFAPCVSAVIDVIDLEALEVSATYEEPMGAEMLVGISRW